MQQGIKFPIQWKLSMLMFLQFFIWGSWFVTAGTYMTQTLGFNGNQVGLAYGTTAIAAMFSPFIIGRIADQWIDIKYLLCALHSIGGVLMLILGQTTSFPPFFVVLMGYALFYMPTFSLVSAITFHHSEEPTRDFSRIRVWGTIAWITAGLIISYFQLEPTVIPLFIAGCCSFVQAIYCLSLPGTMPKDKVEGTTWFNSSLWDVFRANSLLILIIGLTLTSIPSAFYYSFTNLFLTEMNIPNPAGVMSVGQITEIIFMLLLAYFISQFGLKAILVFGISLWGIRYGLFAMGYHYELTVLVYIGVALHGMAYNFSFLIGQIYVDQIAPPNLKSTAQGFVTLITLGVGVFLGSLVAGIAVTYFTTPTGDHQWTWIWLVPTFVGLIAAITIYLFFNPQQEKE